MVLGLTDLFVFACLVSFPGSVQENCAAFTPVLFKSEITYCKKGGVRSWGFEVVFLDLCHFDGHVGS